MRTVCWGSLTVGLALLVGSRLPAGGQDEVKPLLDKALKAMGGADKAARLRAGSFKGKLTAQENGQDITMDLDTSWQGRHQYRLDADMTVGGNNQKILLVINGDKGWASSNGQTKEAPANELPFVKDIFYSVRLPQMVAALRDPEFKLSPLGEANVKDEPAVGVTVAHKDHKDVSLYFNKKTGLPVKMEVRLTTTGGKDITLEAVYGDYKEFDGVRHPTRMTFRADGKEISLELTEVRALDKLDDSIFAQP
jgi:hypothetical protein